MGLDFELTRLAANIDLLVDEFCREPAEKWLSGRLARDGHDVDALSRAVVLLAKNGAVFPVDDSHGFLLLQAAMARASCEIWENLWNQKHPGRHGGAWEGEDWDLMLVWRRAVQNLITECRQGTLLSLNVQEYFAALIKAGACEEQAQDLSDWFSQVVSDSIEGLPGPVK